MLQVAAVGMMELRKFLIIFVAFMLGFGDCGVIRDKEISRFLYLTSMYNFLSLQIAFLDNPVF